MKIAMTASYWKDGRLHDMQLLTFTIDQLDMLMKYGNDSHAVDRCRCSNPSGYSAWQDSIEIGPLDVSAVDSFTLRMTRVIE